MIVLRHTICKRSGGFPARNWAQPAAIWRRRRPCHKIAHGCTACRNRSSPFVVSVDSPAGPGSPDGGTHVRYLMLICGDEREYDTMTEEQAGARMAAWGQYTGALHESGKLRGGERLRPAASATTVRLKGG